MKTTVILEEDVYAQLARAAEGAGVEVNDLANDLVRMALTKSGPTGFASPKPFRQRTHDFGPPLISSQNKVQHLADEIDDREHLRRGGLL